MGVGAVWRWLAGRGRGPRARPVALRTTDLALLAGLVALAIWLTGFHGRGFSDPIQHSAGEDWDWQLTLYGASAGSLSEYQRFPTWNPYTAGGVPLWAHPEFPGFHPAFALPVVLGPERGLKVMLLLHLVLGWAGMVLLGRLLGLRRPWDALPVLLLAGCSVWNYRLVWGHVMVQGFAYLPWVWWLLLRSDRRVVPSAIAGVLLGLPLLLGGPQVYLIGLLTTGLWAALRVPAAPRRGLAAMVAILAPALLIGLGRWIPLAMGAADADRMTLAADAGALGAYDAWSLVKTWAGAAPLQGEHESQPTFHGWLPLALVVPGLAVAVVRQRAMVAVLSVALLLSLANNLPFNPYRLLQMLPGMDAFRYPERFALAYAPLLALLAALGAQALVGGVGRLGRLPALAAALLIALAAVWHGWRALPPEADRWGLLSGTYALPEAVDPRVVPFRQDPDARWNYHSMRANRGCPACRDALGLEPPAGPWGSDLAEIHGEGRLHSAVLEGSVAEVHLTAVGSAELVVRQAARPGWRARVDGADRALQTGDGWIRMDLDPGEHRIQLVYRPPGAATGTLALGAAVLVPPMLWLLQRAAVRRRGRGRG